MGNGSSQLLRRAWRDEFLDAATSPPVVELDESRGGVIRGAELFPARELRPFGSPGPSEMNERIAIVVQLHNDSIRGQMPCCSQANAIR